jgi:hypothetical protein
LPLSSSLPPASSPSPSSTSVLLLQLRQLVSDYPDGRPVIAISCFPFAGVFAGSQK